MKAKEIFCKVVNFISRVLKQFVKEYEKGGSFCGPTKGECVWINSDNQESTKEQSKKP